MAAKYKVVVQKPSGGITYDLADASYSIEREALDPIGAEIIEIPAKTEEEFIAFLLRGLDGKSVDRDHRRHQLNCRH